MAEQTEHPYIALSNKLTTATVRRVIKPTVGTATNIVWYIAGAILVALGLRFVLILFGANAHNGFVSLIYNATWPLIAAFYTVCNFPADNDALRTELSTLVAAAIYAAIAWSITRLLATRHSHT